jgi:endonuclease/exonuclease/phosphatase (EEP) superfamily protein YafD
MQNGTRFFSHLLNGIFLLYFLGFIFFVFFGNDFYRDLFINFLPYIIAFHLPLVLLFLSFHLFLSEHRRITRFYLLFFLLSLFIQSFSLLSPYFHTTKSFASSAKEELKVLSLNVLKTNTDYQRTMEFILKENPDVFGLLELTKDFSKALEPLQKEYPHQVLFPYHSGFGIGLYSKIPLIDSNIDLLSGGIPFIETKVEVQNKKIHLFLVHALPPFNEEMFEARNTSLEQIASLLENEPTIVMGDFNLTPWSVYYKKFVKDSGLVATRDMWDGLQHSWSSWGLHLPIDHIFLSRNIRALRQYTGESVGSDHLPIVAEIALRDE